MKKNKDGGKEKKEYKRTVWSLKALKWHDYTILRMQIAVSPGCVSSMYDPSPVPGHNLHNRFVRPRLIVGGGRAERNRWRGDRFLAAFATSSVRYDLGYRLWGILWKRDAICATATDRWTFREISSPSGKRGKENEERKRGKRTEERGKERESWQQGIVRWVVGVIFEVYIPRGRKIWLSPDILILHAVFSIPQ